MLAASLLVVCGQTAAATEQPLIASPIDQWKLSYDQDSCSLTRHFRFDEDTFALEMTRYTQFDSYDTKIFASALERRKRSPVTAFASPETEREHEYFFNLHGSEWDGIRIFLTPKSIEQDIADPGTTVPLHVRDAFSKDFTLELESLGEAVAALNNCLDDLVTSWGLDPAKQRALSKRIPNDGRWDDWMIAFLKRTESATRNAGSTTTRIRFIVDPDGKPESCKLLDVPEDNSAAQAACDKALKRAKFEPALDEEGKPASSYILIQGSRFRTTSTIRM